MTAGALIVGFAAGVVAGHARRRRRDPVRARRSSCSSGSRRSTPRRRRCWRSSRWPSSGAGQPAALRQPAAARRDRPRPAGDPRRDRRRGDRQRAPGAGGRGALRVVDALRRGPNGAPRAGGPGGRGRRVSDASRRVADVDRAPRRMQRTTLRADVWPAEPDAAAARAAVVAARRGGDGRRCRPGDRRGRGAAPCSRRSSRCRWSTWCRSSRSRPTGGSCSASSTSLLGALSFNFFFLRADRPLHDRRQSQLGRAAGVPRASRW